MFYYILKLLLSSLIIVIVSEIAKRSSFMGALIASLPLTSLLAIVWLYIDTKDQQKVIALSHGIFWIVIPSLIFFVSLPFLLKQGINFWGSLGASILITSATYAGYTLMLSRFGIKV